MPHETDPPLVVDANAVLPPPITVQRLQTVPGRYTQIGKFLRRTSIDELPQLVSILRGQMSFVGPRAALFNQEDLVELRTQKGIHRITPGLTGWAQINGRDELPIPVKVEFDEYYVRNRSLWLDLKIIMRTLLTVITSEGIAH